MYDYSNTAHINKVQILYIIKDQKINVMLKYIRLLMLNISVCFNAWARSAQTVTAEISRNKTKILRYNSKARPYLTTINRHFAISFRMKSCKHLHKKIAFNKLHITLTTGGETYETFLSCWRKPILPKLSATCLCQHSFTVVMDPLECTDALFTRTTEAFITEGLRETRAPAAELTKIMNDKAK